MARTEAVPSSAHEPRRVLAWRWEAWALSSLLIAVGQAVMWRGWNASGEWVPVTGTTALTSYGMTVALAAAPIVLALFILRCWLSLGIVLATLLLYSWTMGESLSTSTSSTAGFAWFGPTVYGLPLVGILCLGEYLGPVVWSRVNRRP